MSPDSGSRTVAELIAADPARIGEAAARLRAKRWLDRWPALRVADALRAAGCQS